MKQTKHDTSNTQITGNKRKSQHFPTFGSRSKLHKTYLINFCVSFSGKQTLELRRSPINSPLCRLLCTLA
jgi:hypothetical protein